MLTPLLASGFPVIVGHARRIPPQMTIMPGKRQPDAKGERIEGCGGSGAKATPLRPGRGRASPGQS
jgi:hypothetical protein